MPNSFGAQLYDISDPWAHGGPGDGDKRNGHATADGRSWVLGNQTKCCSTWNNTKNATNDQVSGLQV
jgi:hypothetical protein